MWFKKLIKISVVILTVVTLLITGIWIYLYSTVPSYSGEIELDRIGETVTIDFDKYGIPHITAQSKEDAYRALGYLQASERMYQIEMMRRIGKGRLSEVFGAEYLKTDLLFRSLFTEKYFEHNRLMLEGNVVWMKELSSFIDGVNQWIQEEHAVPEFLLLGIEPDLYTIEDAIAISGYMAYSFGMAQKTDPLVEDIKQRFGEEYLRDIALYHYEGEPFNNSFERDSSRYSAMAIESAAMINQLPIPAWHGSNSWVVSGRLTHSGKPILCNDTHIGFGMPQVWYESHLMVDGWNFYGNFLPGLPFALVGHNDAMAWGLTMLEHDDMDFYIETVGADRMTYLQDSTWIPFQTEEIIIPIKGQSDTVIDVQYSHHGPLIQGIFEGIDKQDAVSMWWDFVKFDNKLLEAFYTLNNASKIDDFKKAASLIHGPGLNVTYADTSGNIAWWACAKIQRRPIGQKSKQFLDGSTSNSQPLGYYPFEKNPHSINPPWEFICTANDQPDAIDSIFVQGYFKPHYRASRIKELLIGKRDWTVDGMKPLITDVKNPNDAEVSLLLYDLLSEKVNEGVSKDALDLLKWDGEHEVDDSSPTFYYRLLYYILKGAMEDEIGEDGFSVFLSTHWMQRGFPLLIANENSVWWDDIHSTTTEAREQIIITAFSKAVDSLVNEFGNNVEDWNWQKVHKTEYFHAFGKENALFRKMFNSPRTGVRGGNESVSQASFKLRGHREYDVVVGPQMRIIIDMANPRNSVSISPAGQSGHFLSPHYCDQFEMYNHGQFRPQLQEDVMENCPDHFTVIPSSR